MEVVSIFILLFLALQVVVATINYIFPERLHHSHSFQEPFISVLIPARNEEQKIGALLKDLKEQMYSSFEVLVYNDDSTDNTERVVRTAMSEDSRVRLIETQPLPEGWFGKQHACYQLASKANGEYFLFLDADVRAGKDFLQKIVATFRSQKVDFLSIFPQQEMNSISELLSVPLMNFILLSLLPLRLVRLVSHHRVAAANGQVMLFKSTVYRQLQPHLYAKQERAEDIVIARYLKSHGVKTSCCLGDYSIRCRMYTHLNEALNGFAKNIIAMLCNSHLCALWFVFVHTFGIAIVLLSNSFLLTVIFFILIIILRGIITIASQQPWKAFLLFPFQNIVLLAVLLLSYYRFLKKDFIWKERRIF